MVVGMFSLVSFTGILRHRRQAREGVIGPVGDSGVNEAESPEEYFPHDDLGKDYDPATANDFSYEDAVLDAKVRLFMRQEYGRIEPPRGVFERLIRLVNGEQAEGRARNTAAWARLFVATYRAFSGQTLSRMLPSGIAVAILVVVGLGSNTPGLLRNSPFSVGAQSTPVAAQAAGDIYQGAPMEAQITQEPRSVQSTLDVMGGEEAYIVTGGRSAVNLPLQVRQAKDPDNIKYNRPRLDPF